MSALGYVLLPETSMLAEGLTALFQILYLISAFRVIPDPGFTVMEHVLLFISVSSAADVFLIHILLDTNTDLTQGLYPTLIIILVAMQKSPLEYYSTYSTRMQFARKGPVTFGRRNEICRHRLVGTNNYAVFVGNLRSWNISLCWLVSACIQSTTT